MVSGHEPKLQCDIITMEPSKSWSDNPNPSFFTDLHKIAVTQLDSTQCRRGIFAICKAFCPPNTFFFGKAVPCSESASPRLTPELIGRGCWPGHGSSYCPRVNIAIENGHVIWCMLNIYIYARLSRYMGIVWLRAICSVWELVIEFIDVVHVCKKLCTFHRSCARFTRPPNNVRVQLL